MRISHSHQRRSYLSQTKRLFGWMEWNSLDTPFTIVNTLIRYFLIILVDLSLGTLKIGEDTTLNLPSRESILVSDCIVMNGTLILEIDPTTRKRLEEMNSESDSFDISLMSYTCHRGQFTFIAQPIDSAPCVDQKLHYSESILIVQFTFLEQKCSEEPETGGIVFPQYVQLLLTVIQPLWSWSWVCQSLFQSLFLL